MGFWNKLGGAIKIGGGIASEVVAPGNPGGVASIGSGTQDIVKDATAVKKAINPPKTQSMPKQTPSDSSSPLPPYQSTDSFDHHKATRRQRNPIAGAYDQGNYA